MNNALQSPLFSYSSLLANTFSTSPAGLPVQIPHSLTSPALRKQICLSLLHLPVSFLLSHQSRNCRGNNERITRPWRQGGKKGSGFETGQKRKKTHENSKIDMLETLWVKAGEGTAIRTAGQRKCQKKKWLAARAQLECHYGIAIMTYYLTRGTPDPTGDVAPVKEIQTPFSVSSFGCGSRQWARTKAVWVKPIILKADV